MNLIEYTLRFNLNIFNPLLFSSNTISLKLLLVFTGRKNRCNFQSVLSAVVQPCQATDIRRREQATFQSTFLYVK